MKKTVSAICAAILVMLMLVPCLGTAEEYYTPGRIAVPETGVPFSLETEQGSGELEYEAVLDGRFMEQLEVEYEKDDVEYEVLYDILGDVVSAEYENGDDEIYYNGSAWTDGNGNPTTGPDLSFMKKYYNDFQLEPQEIYKNNTLGVVGISLRETNKNLTDKWYHVVPVDLTKEGTFRYKLVSGNLFYMGYCDVTVAEGKVTVDYYGRPAPKHAHGTGNLEEYTSSTGKIMDVIMELYTRVVDPELLIRRVNIAACNLIREENIPVQQAQQLSLFEDEEAMMKKRADDDAAAREKKIQTAMIELQRRFGKNAVLKGMNFEEGGTTIERNGQIGGHKA